MSYQSKYTGQQIDNKLDQVDNKSDLNYVDEQLNSKANNSDYKIKVYTDPTIFGLSYNTMTMQNIVDALPNNTILTFWVNNDCPNIYDSVCEGVGTTNGYGNISFKKIQNATRIIFEQYGSNVTLTYNHTTTNNVGWSSTGWSLNAFYPVGSIYMSYTSTSPASLFGGTWTQIKDKVLMSAGDTYTGGSTGGSATHTHTSAAHTHTVAGHTHTSAAHTHTVAGHTHTTAGHTLTIAEMPSHTHQVGTYHGGVGDGSVVQRGWGSETVHKNLSVLTNTGGGGSHSHGNTGSTSLTTDSTTPGATGSTSLTTNSTTPGNTGSSSNLPPYLTIYTWRRTA